MDITSENQLINESSTYLQQHANNLVNWFPWGNAAIELARKQEKPILLSIGYSACHWCHVMMHESFMDPNIAATMNRLFINIKVDKQERPDLDKIYQTAHQVLMGQPGGWPLTLFLSSTSLIPYFSATYLPKEPLPEMPDFESLLHRLNEVYYHAKDKIQIQEARTKTVLQMVFHPRASSELPLASSLRESAEAMIRQEFDPINGGFGVGAKFPNCPSLEFLLESEEALVRHIALSTLTKMAQGGIYDQLAGGFFRYTVDEEWQIPHFEKMLYDNAQVLSIYAKAYALTKHQEYRQIVLETVDFLVKNLQDSNTGCFYSAIDADSEGIEGSYYVWDIKQINSLLNPDELSNIQKFYKLDKKANFENLWHLAINSDCPVPPAEKLAIIKQKLLAQRAKRTAPSVDRMIICAHNGLMVKNLSEAGKLLNQKNLLTMAEKLIEAIQATLFSTGYLFASTHDGKTKIHGFLDDYAFLLDGILAFTDDNSEHKFMPFCRQLADGMIKNFFDEENGGFFFTANNAEQLFYRPKTYTDDVIPSGNGVACLALLKLGKLLKNNRYTEAAKRSIYTAQSYLNDAPELHLSLCKAYSLAHSSKQK